MSYEKRGASSRRSGTDHFLAAGEQFDARSSLMVQIRSLAYSFVPAPAGQNDDHVRWFERILDDKELGHCGQKWTVRRNRKSC